MVSHTERQTGYPSIDKPWKKYFPEGVENRTIPQETLYSFVYTANKDYPNEYALNYFGVRITFGEVLSKIDECAKSLAKLGVKPDDIVTIMGLSSPETVYCAYACSKIGAVINLINVTAGERELVNYLNEAKSEVLIALDLFNDTVSKAIPKTRVKSVVNLSLAESMPFHISAVFKLKAKIKKIDSFLSWKDFVLLGKELPAVQEYKFIPNRFSVLAHTGGTTGDPKGVMLTDECVNGILDEDILNYDYKRQSRFLNTIPPFYTYGFIVNIHIPLARGMENYLFPKLDPKVVPGKISKNRINVVCSAPQFLTYLPKDKNFQKADHSFIRNIGCGGDGLTNELEKEINEIIAPNKIMSGYGLSEIGSMACGNFNKEFTGSVGYPLSKNVVSVFDQNNKELKYGEIGEICFLTPYMMLGYYDNPEATAEAIRVHSDGNRWFHSGDLGYVTEKGSVYITGRLKRIILTIYNGQGNKIYPDRIDKLIESHKSVEASCTVKCADDSLEIKLSTYVVLKKEYAKDSLHVEQELVQLCMEKLPEYSRPSKYVFCDRLPMTAAEKVDFKALEEMEKDKKD